MMLELSGIFRATPATVKSSSPLPKFNVSVRPSVASLPIADPVCGKYFCAAASLKTMDFLSSRAVSVDPCNKGKLNILKKSPSAKSTCSFVAFSGEVRTTALLCAKRVAKRISGKFAFKVGAKGSGWPPPSFMLPAGVLVSKFTRYRLLACA
ncbi:MAG: hypothetical protein ALAOOOJD_00260 [bacterium]|nr:hypothetical protein [bacterium]